MLKMIYSHLDFNKFNKTPFSIEFIEINGEKNESFRNQHKCEFNLSSLKTTDQY